jgi:hydrogenase maturation protease
MTAGVGSLVVIGVGNVLLRDDGAGVEVVREIERRASRGDPGLSAGTALVDGGTLGLGLLPLVAGARGLILVDAVDGGHEPGAVEVLRGEAVFAAAAGGGGQIAMGRGGDVAMGRGGLGELLAAARLAGADSAAIVLVGIQPAEIAVGLELTAAIRRAMPAAIEITLNEMRRMTALPPAARQAPARRRSDPAECVA